MKPSLRKRLADLDRTRAADRPPTLLRTLLDEALCAWPDVEPDWRRQRDAEDGARIAAAALPHTPPAHRAEVFRSLLGLARARHWDPFSLPLVIDDLRTPEREDLLDALLDAGRVHDLARIGKHLDGARWRSAYALARRPCDHAALLSAAPPAERPRCAADLRTRLLATRLDIASYAHDAAVAAAVAAFAPRTRDELLLRVFADSNRPDGSAGSALRYYGSLVTDVTLPAALPLLAVGSRNDGERALLLLFLAEGSHARAAPLRDEAAGLATAIVTGDPSPWSGRDLDLLLELARHTNDATWQRHATAIVTRLAPDQDEDNFEPIHWDHLLPRVAPDQRDAWLQAIDIIDDEGPRDDALAAACRHW